MAQKRDDAVVRQRVRDVIVAPMHRLVRDDAVNYRFVDRLHDRVEERTQSRVGDQFQAREPFAVVERIRVRRRKREEQVARTVSGRRPATTDPESHAPCQRLS